MRVLITECIICFSYVITDTSNIFAAFKNAVGLAIFICLLISCSFQSEREWTEEEGYRWAEVKAGYFGSTGFEKLSSSRTNIKFRNDVSRVLMEENRHYLNGSGVAVGDIDGDGLVDIYFARLDGPNKLFKNLGNYSFKDITDIAGVSHEGYNSTGVVFADVNGNGFLDLLISSLSEGNVLYLNDGLGNFKIKENSGLGDSKGAKTMALADINGNGYLDLYITNYNFRSVRDLYSRDELSLENTIEVVEGETQVQPSFQEYFTIIKIEAGIFRDEIGQEDELYINKGDGFFEKADALRYFFDEDGNQRGLSSDWGLTATFRDITGNMLPDLYVANDFWTPDRIWINQGDGTFRAIDKNAIRNMSYSAMGVDFSDIDRNGSLDFVVTEMLSQNHAMRMRQMSEHLEEFEGRTHHNRNSVFLNRGDNTFAQIADYSGFQASEWSWATYFLDIDLDGYEDLIVATGFAYDYQDMDTQIALHEHDRNASQGGGDILEYPELKLANRFFRNEGDLTFTDQSSNWGFDVEDISLGMALADLNNDGTPEIIINRFNEEAAVYENRTNAPRIAVRLKGEYPNTQGIGAKIKLEGGPVVQQKEIVSGGNYLSGSQAQAVFAADNRGDHSITVSWPGGKKSRIQNVKANRIYIIDEETAEAKTEFTPPVDGERPMFEDISETVGHRHHENEYNDFRFSPLLPQKLSRLGPGIAWIDYNRNGLDDLFIASGKDGKTAVFENAGEGNFTPLNQELLRRNAFGDQTAIISWSEENYTNILIGSANYEQGNPDAPSAYLYKIDQAGTVKTDSLPGVLSTTGPIAAADVSGNGHIDVFVGGRFKPGQYPVDADSRLFKHENGRLLPDETNSRTLAGIGLVTGAVFTDYNQNGSQDLLVSTEWGSLRLFENRNGTLREVTSQMGLNQYKGWWKGVATGDFTGNGLPDFVATNIGLNSSYQTEDGKPLKMYYDDFNRDGRLNIAEAYYDYQSRSYVPRRKLHDFGSISMILQNVGTHGEFATSSVDKIFNRDFSQVPSREINTLEHMVFINTGKGFTAHPLPAEAQFSSAFHVGVADFDNDGNEDLFLSQNNFSFFKNTPRLDAGRGLILKGDGEGNFTPLSGNESGIKVYGEQRGVALSDFNENGRTDLAVTQNNGETKLYLNRTDKAGIRVRLIGREYNRDAIGSSLRMVYADGRKGPRREIQAGSGYWSQNSTIQVLGTSGDPVGIKVTWQDGKTELVDIDHDGKEQVITASVNTSICNK